MPDPVHSYGTVLKRGDGATPEIFTTIPKVFDFGDSPVAEPGKLDVRNADSADFTVEYIADWREPPEITFQCYWDSTDPTQTAIIADSVADPPTKHNYRKVYSNAKVRQFYAYPVVKEGADLKGALTLSVKLVCSGGSTLT